MRIGIIIDHLQAGGITTSQYEQSLMYELDRSNSQHEFIIFTWSDLTKENTSLNKRLKYISFNDTNTLHKKIYRRGNKFIKRLVEYYITKIEKPNNTAERIYCLKQNIFNSALIENKIDIVYSMFGNGFRATEIPYIANCFDCNDIKHSFLPEFNVTFPSWEELDQNRSVFFRRATYIIAGTNSLKEQLVRYYGAEEEKIHINPFVPSKLEEVKNYFEPVKDFKNDLPARFLFIPARYIPQKNHVLILLALRELREKNSMEISLVCVGLDKGNLHYLKQKTKEFGLEHSVHFYGAISFQDLVYLYKKAFALVFPVFNGPDNLPPIEAMSYDCPVIASRLEGSDEQFGDAVLFFDPTNEFELADRIRELIETPGLREDLIKRGKNCIKDKTPENYVRNLVLILDKFAKKRRAWGPGFYNLYPNFNDK